MKVAVVDDNVKDRNALIMHLREASLDLGIDLILTSYSLGENFLEDEDFSNLDVVFLDIYMGEKNGMEVAKALREKNYSGLIVFCTQTSNFAIEGYSVRASNYIIKPANYEEIKEMLRKIENDLNKEVQAIRIKDGREWYKINIPDILYVDNNGNYVRVYTYNNSYSTRMSLNEMEELLKNYKCFVKCERGIVVNLMNVKEIQVNTILLKNDSVVPVSRRSRNNVRAAYFKFIFREIDNI